MELNEAMENRRSIRSYQAGTPIDKNVLEQLVQAAQQAPSWKNSQTGRYYIVTDPDKMAEVKAKCLPEGNASNCNNAQALIVTAYVKNRSGFEKDGTPDNEIGNTWGAYDLGLQAENLLLKATELGLGTLVMGLRDGNALRACLNIPDSQEVMSVISVGYPAVEPQKPKRKAVDDIVVWY